MGKKLCIYYGCFVSVALAFSEKIRDNSIKNIQEVKSLAAIEKLSSNSETKAHTSTSPNLNLLRMLRFCGAHRCTLCCFFTKILLLKFLLEKSFIYYEYKSMTSFSH